MDCSTPGFPILHCLPELAQTYVHWVGGAIQPSHPPLSPSLPALGLSQHQSLFHWVSSSYQVAKVLELQHQSFNEYSGLIPLALTGLISLQSKGFILKSLLQHQFVGAQPSLWSNSHIRTWSTGKTIALTIRTFVIKVMFWSRFSSKEWMSFNIMAAVTICSDFGAQESKICHSFHFFPHLFAMKWWDWMPLTFIFWIVSFKPAFSLSSFTFIKRLCSSSSLSAIR